ncbi:hypothetical protein CCR95_01530 [Thiocystis minor]|uniref:hypothetical protein n=1 Tax=Thiocystis minor TaxID=61597 RepID=UPI0019132992|nr:hypothetical protein [Thiocystis minor]MBK5962808.1 hypothetical protein [Thiocystis minor]
MDNYLASRLIICGCGPGELVAWVRPLLAALAQTERRWQTTLVLWPRLFLSGHEAETARQLPGVDQILSPGRSLALLAGAPLPWSDAGPRSSVLLHMGGAPFLSLRLGRRLGAPVLAYCEQPNRLPSGFNAIYCTDSCKSMAAGVTPIGNLLVDAVFALRDRRLDLDAGDPALILGLLPGSRAFQLRHYLTRVGPVADALSRRVDALQFLIARSPLVDDDMVRDALGTGAGARMVQEQDVTALITDQGLRIPLVDPAEVLCRAHCLLSTPGTNTGEAAALGIPHLVVAPFDPSFKMFSGMLGLIERSHWLGRPLKRWALRYLTGDGAYYAQANARAGHEIVPELQGPLDIERVTDCLANLLLDAHRRKRISSELSGVMGPPGAASRLVSELERKVVESAHNPTSNRL